MDDGVSAQGAPGAQGTPTRILLLPGLGGSGPEHWQRLWAASVPGARIVEQEDWDRPDLGSWCVELDRAVRREEEPFVLVAHSLGCALAARWVDRRWSGVDDRTEPLRGILMVAPADVESELRTPELVRSFAPWPTGRLPCPGVVVASRDDPYVDPLRARALARGWGAEFVDAGAGGHLNAASGLGEWLFGLGLLASLMTQPSEAS